MAKLLVAEDDITTLTLLSRILRDGGYEVLGVQDGLQAMRLLSADIELAIFDLDLPKASGFECMNFVQREYSNIPIIVISGAGIDDAVKTMKRGAYWFIPKPFESAKVLEIVERALEHSKSLSLGAGDASDFAPAFVGASSVIRQIREEVIRVSENDSPVLIRGERGTGKSVLAHLIHHASARARGPFISVSCSSLPESLLEAELFGNEGEENDPARIGRVESAENGTLFLDAIDTVPVSLQSSLVKLIEEGTYQPRGASEPLKANVRIIATSHEDLEQLAKAGDFLPDLFYRLNVITFTMPPLRERSDDIPQLVDHLLEKIALRRQSRRVSIEADAVTALCEKHWSGNVRELENALERASAFCADNSIQLADLIDEQESQEQATNGTTSQLFLGGIPLDEIERRALIETLKLCGGNKAATARTLGISERSVYNKLKRFNIST